MDDRVSATRAARRIQDPVEFLELKVEAKWFGHLNEGA
jgi:hypothetical protein